MKSPFFKTPNPSLKPRKPPASGVDKHGQDFIQAAAALSKTRNFNRLATVLVEQIQDISRSDLAAFYLFEVRNHRKGSSGENPLTLASHRGRFPLPQTLSGKGELVQFLRECREVLVFNNPDGGKKCPGLFYEVLLHPEMHSGMVLPIFSRESDIGLLFVNSLRLKYYNRERFYFLESYARLAGEIMNNAHLLAETRNFLNHIDALKRYQENVFDSMTNMVVTTGPLGEIHYFNRAAGEILGLKEDYLGRPVSEVFKDSLTPRVIKAIDLGLKSGEQGALEGIFKPAGREARSQGGEIDYSLAINPIQTSRGRKEGLTLLFTNQTLEKELQAKVRRVSEERRVIKDMFCRYMSNDVVATLIESPESIKPGGDRKNATVFFADIRGYTYFSESREPEAIIEILNEYFSEAVEQVLAYRGFIDKFIGDCIMAVWGVPVGSEKDDAINAVSCALALQEKVQSARRKFFLNEASRLRIGIGINSGPLVAGNLGSSRRMDYSVIGDTVNLAARLEAAAGPNEIIISQSTRAYLDGHFKLEDRPFIRVKGKEKPIQIYNVIGLN
ncbi:MAG: GAF domain-containing protein [Spirochaetales bacterium]|jgi:PAS domain S-box-containing protein|nr:GAF domain-containing protein [Spirochaetales bacterium]